ncbi:MAG: PEP-CTERM sorting domain-containing protein [Chromatiales bacterium]|nr:PEP-CTERM sorting domain-containing protein [Chromatiales bacterium]
MNSLVDFSTSFSLTKSIVPVPAPTTPPLVALGLGLIGLARVRRGQVTG